LTARAGFLRDRNLFFEEHPIALMPISGALPFADQADTEGFERFGQIIEAQPTQLGLLLMGLPDLPVATGFVGKCPLGVQLVAGRPPRGPAAGGWRGDRRCHAGHRAGLALKRPPRALGDDAWIGLRKDGPTLDKAGARRRHQRATGAPGSCSVPPLMRSVPLWVN
jgi:hypothetical protein